MTDFTQYEEAARELGTEHGRAAGSWILDGNSSRESAQRLLDMIEDGDPELWDSYASPLSGEWADGRTPDDILSEIDYPETRTPEEYDDIIRAYEDAHSSAWESEVNRLALIYAAPAEN
jgi:hypothetical protein